MVSFSLSELPCIVCRLGRPTLITPHLCKLHWLPIEHYIPFKLNCLTFIPSQFNQPTYLSTLIKSSTLTRGNRLLVSSFRLKRWAGSCSFEVALPLEWNILPFDIRQQSDFKSLKMQVKISPVKFSLTLIDSHMLFGNELSMYQRFPFCMILSNSEDKYY